MEKWPKHPRKELEALLGEFYEAGWRIEKRRKYYMVFCPCGDHKRTIHLTPSNPNYAKEATRWLRKKTCHPREEAL